MEEGRRASDRGGELERIAVLEHMCAGFAGELERHRGSLHDLKGERSAIVALTRELGHLREELGGIAAAAVARALAERDEQRREELEERRGGLSLRMQAVALFVAGAGTVASILLGVRG